MENSGWIKLHRKIFDNPVVTKDPDHLSVWIWLLLNVVHKEVKVDFAGKIIGLKPGQLTCGRQKIAEGSKVNRSKVERVLNLFKSEQQIEQQTTNKCRLITVINWNQYQDNEQQNEQPVSNNRATSEQQVSTKEEYKEDKNNKNIKKKKKEKVLDGGQVPLLVLEPLTGEQHPSSELGTPPTLGAEPVLLTHDKKRPRIQHKNEISSNEGEIEPKKACGADGKVFLTEKQLRALNQVYGRRNVRKMIEELNDYICQFGKDKYKSHYHTIKKWFSSRKEEGKFKPTWGDFNSDDFDSEADYMKMVERYPSI